MENKVVLITGGSSGIGKAVGVFLKSKGHHIIGTTRFLDQKKSDSAIDLVAMDVTKKSTIDAAIAEVISKYGRIDVLVNNAGIGMTGPVEEIPKAEIQKVMDTNFYGPGAGHPGRFATYARCRRWLDHQYHVDCWIYGIALSRDIFLKQGGYGSHHRIPAHGDQWIWDPDYEFGTRGF